MMLHNDQKSEGGYHREGARARVSAATHRQYQGGFREAELSKAACKRQPAIGVVRAGAMLSYGPSDGSQNCCSAAFCCLIGGSMLFPWYEAAMLAFESNVVIAL